MLRLQTERQLDDLKEVNVEEVIFIFYFVYDLYSSFIFILFRYLSPIDYVLSVTKTLKVE